MNRLMTMATVLVLVGSASGQSLFERRGGVPATPAPAPIATPVQAPVQAPATAPASAPTNGTPQGNQPTQGQPVPAPVQVQPQVSVPVVQASGPVTVAQVSLLAVQPPEPRTFKENDLLTIIISERASLQRNQKIESDKSYDVGGKITTLPDWLKLLQLQLASGDTRPLAEWSLDNDQQFEGEGKYKRDDKLTARVTARVLEVKPNGTLLVEARTQVTSDLEDQLIVLSGICRPEDITDQNTLQSSQLFDLRLNIQNTGDVKRSSNKGLIPRVVETIFNF